MRFSSGGATAVRTFLYLYEIPCARRLKTPSTFPPQAASTPKAFS